MFYSKKIKRAMNYCYNICKDKVDFLGVPLIFHICHVAEQMNDEYSILVALLRYTYMFGTTEEDLLKNDFPREVAQAISLTYQGEKESVNKYAEKIKASRVAKTVMLAILKDDVSFDRQDVLDEEQKKYIKNSKKILDLLLK